MTNLTSPATNPTDLIGEHRAKLEYRDLIIIDDKDHAMLACDAWEVLLENNKNCFFRVGRRIVHLENGKICEVNATRLRGMIGQWAKFGKGVYTTQDNKQYLTGFRYTEVPEPVLLHMLEFGHSSLPEIDSVLTAPCFSKRGLIAETGYFAAERVWLQTDLAIPRDLPRGRHAREQIDEIIVDFPTKDRATWVAMALTPFMRLLVPGPYPLFVFSAPQNRSGKTLMVKAANMLATGEELCVQTIDASEEEFKKAIVAISRSSDPIICFDNLPTKRPLDSAVFSALLTAKTFKGRELGTNNNLMLKNDRIWTITGCNPRLSNELKLRSYFIRIDHDRPDPHNKNDFVHPQLEPWILENRPRLVSAALGMIQDWVDAGKPLYTQVPTGGIYYGWAYSMAGLLHMHGYENIFGGTAEKHAVEELEDAFGEMLQFVGYWWERYKGEFVKAGDLVKLANEKAHFLSPSGVPLKNHGMGHKLNEYIDKVFKVGEVSVKLIQSERHMNGSWSYRLQPL